jgi:ABC-type transport system involved in multi-copper enzyme maturation permease subunit
MNQQLNFIACAGLATGAIFGISGSAVSDPTLQIVFYEISSLGMVIAFSLLVMKFFREQKDFMATGFLLFALAEAVMSSGTALGEIGGQASFGAGMALYVPALLFICLPKEFPMWVRIAGIATAIPFFISAAKIFFGEVVLSSSAVIGAGYGLLVLTIIGWILTLYRETRSTKEEVYQQELTS